MTNIESWLLIGMIGLILFLALNKGGDLIDRGIDKFERDDYARLQRREAAMDALSKINPSSVGIPNPDVRVIPNSGQPDGYVCDGCETWMPFTTSYGGVCPECFFGTPSEEWEAIMRVIEEQASESEDHR